ncbi:hypothetical protein PP707_07665 [Acetobacter pasteurianus]|nr:hypothetical protein [Acetobacter pasteurianus]
MSLYIDRNKTNNKKDDGDGDEDGDEAHSILFHVNIGNDRPFNF